MFVSKRAFDAAQEEVARLRGELRLAQASLADHQTRASDLADAMLAARADARQVLLRAEEERSAILAQTREEAIGAVKAAKAEVAAARAEVERLKQVQRDLSISVEQKLVALRSALTQNGAKGQAAEEPQEASVTDDALPGFPSEVTSAPADRDISHGRVERIKTEWPLAPVLPTQRMSWRSDPGRVEAFRRFMLRPHALGAVVIVLLAVAVGLWWSRPTRGREPVDASAAANAARSAGRAGEVEGGVPKGAGASPQAVASGRELRPRAVNVNLRAVRAVWLRVEADGASRLGRLARAGEVFTFGADREVAIRAGDAGALLISVDGRPFSALGPQGAVFTRRIVAHPAKLGGAAIATAAGETRKTGPTLLASVAPLPHVRSGPARPLSAQPESRPAVLPQPRLPVSLPAPELPRPEVQTPSASGLPATGPMLSNDENDVLHAHEAYFDALGRGDAGRMARLAGDGFTVTGAPATDGSGVPFAISLSKASVDVRGVGAVVSGTGSQRITAADGQIRHQSLLFSEVWIKRGNQWQLTSVRFLSPGGAR